MVTNLKQLYNLIVIPNLKKKFEYKNIHQIPKLKKITINRSLGILAQNSNVLKKSVEEFRLITGQQPIITKSKKSISSFKLRKHMPIGLKVTLRNKLMYQFLERFINLVLPQIRDFNGLSIEHFDLYGNYNIGLKNQLIFPELDYNKINEILGLNISFITTSKTKYESIELLTGLTLPISK